MKKGYLFGVLGASLIFAGCQSDELPQPEQPGDDGVDQTLYVNMSISGDGTGLSRASSSDGSPENNATDFVDGTGDENKVSSAYFVFYDDKGDVIGNIVQVDVDNLTADTEPVGNTVEKSYTSTVAITLRKNEKKPSQVICYLNPIDPANLSRPLSVMQTVERSNFSSTTSDGRTFAMSNSVFYPEDPDNLGTVAQDPQIAVAIPDDALYTSKAAAEAALTANSSNVIKIYVERYATRLNFSTKKEDGTPANPEVYETATRVYNNGAANPQTNSVDLTFVPVRWALNAEAKVNYVIKSFREQTPGDGEVAANNYSFTSLNNVINDGLGTNDQWVWNNFDFHRSYWGMSPAYFQDKYPEVQSDLAGIDDLKQTYLTYNQLTRTNSPLGYAPTDDGNKYFRETTVGSMALASENPAAAVASVIYVGKYVIKVADNDPLPEGTSFYTYLSGTIEGVTEPRPYVYFESLPNSAESAVTDGESMLKRFFAQSTILYRQQLGEDGEPNGEYSRLTIDKAEDVDLLRTGLQVSEISEDVKIAAAKDGATEENPHPILKLRNNARTLQFKSAEEAAGIYIVNNNAYKEIVADDVEEVSNTQIRLTDANVALMRQIGYSYFYNLGHGYFNIPVKHLGWYRKGNTQKETDKINWNLVKVGDFGMVRNHTYSINVSKIIGLANGIGGDDVEIVPPSNTEDYFMAYSVRILKWAVVPTQNVEL